MFVVILLEGRGFAQEGDGAVVAGVTTGSGFAGSISSGSTAAVSPPTSPAVVTPPPSVDLPPITPGGENGSGSSTIVPPSLYGIQGGGSVELGQKVMLLVSLGTATDGLTFKWMKGEVTIAGATASSYVIEAAVAGDAATYTVVVSNSAGSSVASTALTVKPAAAPVITSSPGNLVRQVGQQAAFYYTATGSYPRTHQWRKNGADIPGATAATRIIDAVTTGDAGTYSVVVTNSLGTATSLAGALTVNAATPVVLASGYPYDVTATQGSSATLSVALSSGSSPYTYQWMKNGVPIPGATASQLPLNPVAFADAGKYSVTVTNAAGSDTSREATVTVDPPTPITFLLQPRSETIYQGQSISFGVGVSGSSPVTYQWRKNGSPIAGATNNYYSIPAVTLADAGNFSVLVTNPAGSVSSSVAELIVKPAVLPAVIRQPQGQTLAYGSQLNLSVEVSGSTPLSYQWKKDGVSLGSAGTASYYSLYSTTPANSGVYTVVITNAAGSVTSASATVTVQAAVAPTITQQPVGQTVAYGAQMSLSVEVSGSPPLSYQWRKDGVSLGSAGTSSYYNLYSATPANSGVYTVVVTNTAGSVTSASATVTVQAAVAPTITQQPVAQALAYGSQLNLSVTASGSPTLSYQWKKDGVSLGSGGGSNYYNVYSATPANSGLYTVVVTNSAGSVTSAAATVTVEAAIAPTITRQPVGQILAYGSSLDLSVAASGSPPLSYQWKKDGVSLGSGGTSSYYSLYNATPANSGVYTVVVTNPAGSVTSTSATVTVQAAIAPTITRQPVGQTVAYGGQLNLTVEVTGSPPLSYQWKKDGVSLGSGATSSYYNVYNATPANSGVYTVVVTNGVGSVTSDRATVTVQAAVAPTITQQPADKTLAYGETLALRVQAAGSPPLSYQWKKDGVALGSASSANYYTVYGATPLNNGTYTVEITNPAGSVTSTKATVTVQAAIAPTITEQPAGKTLTYGVTARLTVQASGSSPMSFQWKKDGVSLGSGATSNDYYIYNVTPANSGVYTVVVTNPAGSVTSEGATITVQTAVAPTITQQPRGATVAYDARVELAIQATGSPPLTFQWKKDGALVGSGSSSSYFNLYNARPANSGVYTVVVSNSAGAATSSGATVTVQAALVPVITTQPVSSQVATGLSASFSVGVNTTGTGPLTYQWRRNGSALAGATATSFNLASVTAADGGDYTVVISGSAGSATSQVAKLTILPPAPPQVSSWPAVQYANIGDNVSLSVYSVNGTPPFTYQWARNGVAIPGATRASLELRNVTDGDYTDYTLTISNAGGLITSPPIRLLSRPDTGTNTLPWLDAGRVNDIAYFLAVSPSRIERYDLAGQRWLPSVILSETAVPTAFAPASDGIYLAYGRTLVRRTLDLAGETPITSVPIAVNHLFVFGDWLYYDNGDGRNYGLIRRSSLLADGVAGPGLFGSVAVATSLRKAFARDYWSLSSLVIGTDGKFAAARDSGYYYAFPTGSRTFVFANDQLVADNSGVVYRTDDLTYAGSFGDAFDDLAFLSDGTPVVLRGSVLSAVQSDTLFETGRTMLAKAGARLFTRGTDTFVFGAPAVGTAFTVAKVGKTAYVPRPKPTAGNPPVGRYSVDDAYLAGDDVVCVFSRTLQSLVRWSAANRSFLSTLPLRGAPVLAYQQPGLPRALFTYSDGVVTALPFGSADGERQIGAISNRAYALTDLGDMAMVNIYHSGDSGQRRLVLGADGRPRFLSGWSYWGEGLAYEPNTRRLYSRGRSSSSGKPTVDHETVPSSGILPAGTNNPAENVAPPLRFNAEGTLIATGSGRVLNVDLAQMGVLANDILDATWLPDGLYTLRSLRGEAEVQQWTRVSYLLTRSRALHGIPVRLLPLSDGKLVVVTADQGIAMFTVLNADLTVSTSATPKIVISSPPRSQTVAPAAAATFSVSQSGATGVASYQWLRDGTAIAGATATTLSIAGVQPANVGLYSAVVADATNSTTTEPAILGLTTDSKVIGSGSEVGPNIQHASGNIYDQVLLQGSSASVTADTGQVLRLSYIDMDDDIVQLEFSGAGTLSVVLSGASSPAAPTRYNQPGVSYVKGHAAIVITGANETTNVSVFSVGRVTATNQALFRSDVTYDGVADIAYIAILSSNGKFGGVRAANANFFNSTGPVGLYAPSVQFTGPVYVGNIDAFGDASPMLIFGSAADARITGGDLLQTNSRPVKVRGLTQLKFTDGSTSHGILLPAQANRGRLDQNGVDVTDQLVVDPTP